jgi:3-oxoadipate enol-lactonase
MTDINWTHEGLSLAYATDGTGTRTAIAIHEMGGSLETFSELLPLLRDEFRLLRYDQRGAGRSEKPRQPFTFDEHVGDLERVIDAAGVKPPFYVIGLAAGCAIGVAFAHRHPKDVAALALCAPALSVSADRKGYLAGRTELAISDGMRAIEGDTLTRSYPARYRERDPARFAAYRALFLANDPVGYGHINMAFANSDVSEAIASLRAPCLLLGGEHDALRPPDQVRAMLADIAHAQYAIIDAGHIMPLQAPAAMAAALRGFFSRQTS